MLFTASALHLLALGVVAFPGFLLLRGPESSTRTTTATVVYVRVASRRQPRRSSSQWS
jgi:hypothetical protein